ncbi:MAG TPA: hypothetical protein VFF04_04935 [Candidatus Babeliales bacterium]|nr:hypothetical protein [Candidatus Babeliales bacterium]
MKRLFILFIFCCVYMHNAYSAEQLSKPTEVNQGNASPNYQQLFRKALKDFGVKNAEKIPIYKFEGTSKNAVTAAIDNKLIIIDERKLHQDGEFSAEFRAYREAAHCYLHSSFLPGILRGRFHDNELLARVVTGLTVASAVPLSGLAFLKLVCLLKKNDPLFRVTLRRARALSIVLSEEVAALTVCLYTAYLGSNLVNASDDLMHFYSEQEADYEAVKMLAKLGKNDAIIAGIQNTPYDGKLLKKKYEALMAKKAKKEMQIKSKL